MGRFIMKNIGVIKKLMVCSSVVALLASCSNKSNKGGVSTIDAASILADTSITKEQKSEKLAKAAEQLLSAQGFAYASDVADLSLQTDSANVRAQFVKAILAPIMVHKGIYKRIKPLADLSSKTSEQYAQSIAEFEEKTPRSTAKEFLLDGPEDIKNEADIQNYFDAVAESFKAVRIFAKANKNSDLTIMATDNMFDSMTKRFQEGCQISEVWNYGYEVNCPDVKSMMEVKLNRGDFEVIQHTAAGYELYFSLMNSYNLSGSIDKALKLDGEEENSKKTLEDLLTNKDFATLRSGNGFKKIKEMGVDAIAGMRWIMQNQNTLCPFGKENGRNRIGHLMNQGVCTNKSEAVETSKNMTLAMDVLMGKVIDNVVLYAKHSWQWDSSSGYQETHDEFKTSIKPVLLIDNPITDLRSIIPTSYDKCGNGVTVKDPTLGGIFVKGDFNTYLAKTSDCKKK